MDEKASLLSLPAEYGKGMKEQPKYKWWKPIVAALLAAVFTVIFVIALAIVLAIAANACGATSFLENLLGVAGLGDSGNYLGFDGDDPFGLAFSFGNIIVIIPAIILACKITGLVPFGRISSVEGKLRWDRIEALFPWALLVIVAFTALQLGIAVATGEDLGEVRFPVAAIIVILVLCPLQCAAEEYMCRGFLMQAFQSWIPVVIVPLILQTIAFALLHGYNIVGNVSVALMGLLMGYLTVKTGGLEAGICIHSANNLVSFLMGAIFVTQQTQSEISMVDFGIDLALQVAFLVVVYLVCKRKGYLLK